MNNTWLLNCPAPACGQLANGYYNAGPMLADDRTGETPEDSRLQVCTQVSESDFDIYIASLKAADISSYLERNIGADKFFAFTYEGNFYHVSYLAKRNELRIVEDKISTPLPSFEYHRSGEKKTILYQYGLYYDPQNNVTDKTVNCGMLYIIRLSDNSLFLIDGGHIRQWNDPAMDAFWKFLLSITDTPENGTIRISGWYCTHAHDDHTNGFTKLLTRHRDQIILERVMFNFPYYGYCGGYSISTYDMKKAVSEWYPEAKVLKLHTGQIFNLADMTLEVYYTHEDAAEAKELSRIHLGDFNCTSSILKLTIDGRTVMMLGDTNIETEALLAAYSDKALWKADMVQVAHHCFNYLDTLYEWIAAPVAMLPNSYFAGHRYDNIGKLAGVLKYVKNDQIYYEGSGTDAFAADTDGWKQIEHFPLTGGEYDYSGY